MSQNKLLGWKDIPIASIIPEPATAKKYRTGDWRTFRPVIDLDKCIGCLLCWIYCPDASIKVMDVNGKVDRVEIDYEHCKGCGICANECPTKAISMVREEK